MIRVIIGGIRTINMRASWITRILQFPCGDRSTTSRYLAESEIVEKEKKKNASKN